MPSDASSDVDFTNSGYFSFFGGRNLMPLRATKNCGVGMR